MMEYIYYRYVKLIAKRRTQTLDDLQNSQIFCKKLIELFETVKQKVAAHRVIPYNEQWGMFKIITTQYYRTKNGSRKAATNTLWNCIEVFALMKKWSRYHFPFSHIMTGCLTCNLDWKHYIESYHYISHTF